MADLWHGANPSEAGPLAVTPSDLGAAVLTPLVSLALPAGSFFLVAKTTVADRDEASIFYCTLTRQGSPDLLDYSLGEASTDNPATISLQAAVTLPSPDTVELKCGSSGPNSFALESKLDAIEVSAVH